MIYCKTSQFCCKLYVDVAFWIPSISSSTSHLNFCCICRQAGNWDCFEKYAEQQICIFSNFVEILHPSGMSVWNEISFPWFCFFYISSFLYNFEFPITYGQTLNKRKELINYTCVVSHLEEALQQPSIFICAGVLTTQLIIWRVQTIILGIFLNDANPHLQSL